MCRANRIAALGLIALFLATPALAGVYMERDAEGNVVFTDRPSTRQARPVELSPVSTYRAAAIPAASGSLSDPGDSPPGYEYVTIISPQNDSPVRENGGALEVMVDLSPRLKPSHRLMLLMDGVPVSEGQDMNLSVHNVDRGTHTLQVQVVDEAGNVITASDSITFHMLRV